MPWYLIIYIVIISYQMPPHAQAFQSLVELDSSCCTSIGGSVCNRVIQYFHHWPEEALMLSDKSPLEGYREQFM